ncbi:MAG: hypothetical protein CL609_07065 [Anaerolineaceae bacterium]|nr:hypothetical protein [Anaerolineaceae bacterium]
MRWEKIKINHFQLINGIQTIGVHNTNPQVGPGQSFICFSPSENVRLQYLFVCKIDDGMVWLSGAGFDRWQIGDELVIRGPIGSGFAQPPMVKNIVFGSYGAVSGALMPLIWHGLKQQKNMTYALTYPSVELSAELELISIQEIGDVVDWADILYFEIKREDIVKYNQVFQSIRPYFEKIQIFIHTPVLCYGQSECMICSVKTKHGYQKTCKHGSVFWLGDLEDI